MPEQIPNFIHCSITGERLAVRRDVLLQRIKKAGSLERLKKTYVSRDARRLLKEGKTIDEIRKLLGFDPQHANTNLIYHDARTSSSMANAKIRDASEVYAFWRSSDWQIQKPKPWSDEEIRKTTVDQCLRPNRYYDGECDTCPYFHLCQQKDKRTNGKPKHGVKKYSEGRGTNVLPSDHTTKKN